MKNLQGKVAVVTGAGSGIGRATALQLARSGCALALADINAEALGPVVETLKTYPVAVSTHAVNVADKAQMAAFPDAVLAEHRTVHIVVNNAGVMVADAFETHTLEDFEWLIGINFWGVVYGCKFFLPHLRRSDEGHIVNLSSMFGFYGLPTQTSYCASKFAVRGFTESLRAELAGSGIGVTAIHPGTIRTNIMKAARTRQTTGGLVERGQDLMNRFGTAPERVAAKIEHAIRHNRARVRVGPDSYLTDYLVRLNPALFNTLVGKLRGQFGA